LKAHPQSETKRPRVLVIAKLFRPYNQVLVDYVDIVDTSLGRLGPGSRRIRF